MPQHEVEFVIEQAEQEYNAALPKLSCLNRDKARLAFRSMEFAGERRNRREMYHCLNALREVLR